MSFTLCSHGRQEAPCSQLVSVCAEILTTESSQTEIKKGLKPRCLCLLLPPQPLASLQLSPFNSGGISKASSILPVLDHFPTMALSPTPQHGKATGLSL